MGESMGSPLHGEDHHTRRPRYNQQFLLPSSVPHNMLHASNLDTTPRSAATHTVRVSGPGPREEEEELDSWYIYIP